MAGRVVVSVQQLRKTYGSAVAVDGVSFEIAEGEIFGMVGPNGAGKTTTIECLEGLRRPDSGRLRVLDLDPEADRRTLMPRMGTQLQSTNLPERMKVWEALDLFASLYPRRVDWRQLLDQLGIGDKRDAFFGKLSGGQKQRLFVALALVNDPEVVFLDELTTGLDPQARHAIWDLVRGIRERGKTVFLTTHFLEEAERLCDRVAIMDRGRIVALDTPENLVRGFGGETLVVFSADQRLDARELAALPSVTRVERDAQRVTVYGRGDQLVVEVVNALSARGLPFRGFRTEQPTLEDVFLALTGRAMRE